MSDFTFSSFFITLGFYLFLILLTLIIWNFFWLRPFPRTLPSRSPSPPISKLWQAIHYLYLILFKEFQPDFLFKTYGFEAFSYILFLKRTLYLIAGFTVISFLFGVPYSLGSTDGGDILNSFNLDDDTYKIYFQMIFLILFSGAFYQNLYVLKNQLAIHYQGYRRAHGEEFKLSDKTLRVKGFSRNTSLEVLKQKVRDVLPVGEKENLVAAIIIPNTGNLLDLESRKQMIMLRKANVTLKEKEYEDLKRIDEEMEVIKEKGFISSGNAIICLATTTATATIMSRFTLLRVPFWRNTCLKTKVFCSKCFLCQCCCDATAAHRALLEKEDHENMLAYDLPTPEDISWRNLNSDDLTSGLKRVGLNLLAIVFMVFFTTPASLITVLGLTEFIKNIENSSTPDPSNTLSNLIEKNLSPLIIFLVNQLILYVINLLAAMKRHTRISKTQLNIFNSCYIYMLFNSFIIPALSMTTVESIFSFVSEESSKVDLLLETFYLNKTGSLFVILLIQSATFSFIANILALADLTLNYFNRKMMVKWQENRLQQEIWMRDETDNFPYGVNYATMVVFLIIVLVFSTTVPAISIAGTFYCFFKLFADCWNIFIAHGKEMDSKGRIISRVIWLSCLGGILFELLMIVYYSVQKLIYNVVIMIFVLIFSSLMIWRIEHVEIEKKSSENIEATEEEIREWEKRYKHPLVDYDFLKLREEKL